MRQHPLVNGTTIWDAASMNPSDAYKESISYDANGNIQTFVRNGKEGNVLMDNLVYMYEVDPVTGKKLSNKLRQVKDGVAAAAYAEDLDNQESEDNYQYDAIGNLTKDIKEGITAIDWTVYGKISSIAKAGSTINYTYDASGNRVSKTVTPTNGTGVITFYVRDAQGNTLGIYERDTNKQILWKEQTLYGSSRLGMFRPDADVSAGASDADIASKLWANYVGYQNYELGNHLGSVLATISDKRILVNGVYEADVITAQDYYSFGSVQPGRSFTAASSSHRYGYGGHEKLDEISGTGNSIDMGARVLDTRLGRTSSIDPKASLYPGISPYVYALNTPIQAIDPDGNVVIFINGQHTGEGGTAKYWGGYDRKAMDALGDHNARYVDGALGGFANTLKWYNKGVEETSFWSAMTHRSKTLAGIHNGARYISNYSNVNRKVRENAGMAQGQIDAPNIISKLSEGESIKIVTHSMGTAYSRGYIKALQRYMRSINDDHKIEIVVDVNAFQGSELNAPAGIRTLNKTGGKDGKSVFGSLIYALRRGNISVPTVGPVQGAKDATSEAEKNKSHEIGGMDTRNIPNVGNSGTPQAPVEQGNNNERTRKQ